MKRELDRRRTRMGKKKVSARPGSGVRGSAGVEGGWMDGLAFRLVVGLQPGEGVLG